MLIFKDFDYLPTLQFYHPYFPNKTKLAIFQTNTIIALDINVTESEVNYQTNVILMTTIMTLTR